RRLALRIAQVGQRMESAIKIAGAVDEQQGGHLLEHPWPTRGQVLHLLIRTRSNEQMQDLTPERTTMTAKDKLPRSVPDDSAPRYNARESWRIFGIMAEFVEATERLSAIRPAVSIF